MAVTQEIVVFVIYPLCTLGIAYGVKLVVDRLGSLETKIDRICRRFGDHQIQVEHRLSNIEARERSK